MKRTMIFVALLFVLILDWAALAQAQLDDGSIYDLNWYTIDSGGGAISNEAYMLNGTIGQPDAGTLSGGDYMLVGGFWGGRVATYEVYLPLVMK